MRILTRRALTRTAIIAAIGSAAMLSAAQAQTIGTATTDLNIRSGPDPQFPVIGMMRERQRAGVIGCIEGSRWCQVDIRGRLGWAYSQYMVLSGAAVAVLPPGQIELPQPVATYVPPPVTYRPPPPAVAYQAPATTYRAPAVAVGTTAAAPRVFAGRLVPPQEVIYAATTPPRVYTPPRAVRSFITLNPLDTVWLEGSLQPGAGLPGDIDLVPVPGSRYSYLYVNDYPVLVDPVTRRVVYVSL